MAIMVVHAAMIRTVMYSYEIYLKLHMRFYMLLQLAWRVGGPRDGSSPVVCRGMVATIWGYKPQITDG